ncbi:MAG: DUF3014 domain-containing protein [Elusimicrobia bacterium]|nr:DUF3014 domain-containing protein [Elusimicrobiota bacterium]
MKNPGLMIVLLLLAAGAALGLFGARAFLKAPPPAPGISSAPGEAAPALPANLPPLDRSDDFVRLRASGLSAAPAFAEWLKQESLIPRLAAAMSMIANGKFPRETFAAFAPRGKFAVVKKGGKTFVDPAGYARYDAFAALVSGVDAVAAAKLFEELEPLLDLAHRELGEKTAGARATFLAAAAELLEAPRLEDGVLLKEGKKGIGWVYADEELENRSLAQKQLMRMGPKNQSAVQAKLRAVTLALGNSVGR